MPSFRSDNNAALCPEALESIRRLAGADHAPGYGADEETDRAERLIQGVLGEGARAFFVATGSAANCLAIAALTIGRPWTRALCHPHAHLNEDESTAPELLTGCRVTTVTPAALADAAAQTPASRLTPEDIRRAAAWASRNDVHQAAPGVLTLSNPTEFGEVYTPSALRELCDVAHESGYLVHVDGARFANAVASLAPEGRAASAAARAISTEAGVDALSFGGTKNGLALGEAVCFMPPSGAAAAGSHRSGPFALTEAKRAPLIASAVGAFPFLRKRSGHLLSKHRFVSGPFGATLESGAWIAHAAHANACAARLAQGLLEQGFHLPFATQTNAVFVRLTEGAEATLREWMNAKGLGGFYMFGEPRWRLARLMCAYDTREADVEALLALCAALPRE